MKFCDACGSMMRTEGDTWVCGTCGTEESRDPESEAAMTTRDEQQDHEAPPVVDGAQDDTETVAKPCPAADCDSDRAYYETRPKPGGSYEVRLFTCADCGETWRES